VANASGGSISTSGGNTIHTFTSSGIFIVPASGVVNYLVVAGGGGGACGGGGAGGYRAGSNFSVGPGTYSITVGTGGSAGTSDAGNGGSGGSSFLVLSQQQVEVEEQTQLLHPQLVVVLVVEGVVDNQPMLLGREILQVHHLLRGIMVAMETEQA